jgi:glycosyltransferase involved in cell wall biosynthesis
MKTLFISTQDNIGGAARATHWLAKGLRRSGEDVSMYVQKKTGDCSWVSITQKNRVEQYIHLLRPQLDVSPLSFYPKRIKTQWSLNLIPNSSLRSRVLNFRPDLINLHWVGGGFLPIKDIKKFNVPVVWSLYDMWPFTGGCHYDGGCGRYVNSCGSCPQLGSSKSDITRYIHKTKLNSWEEIPFNIVAPSSWLANEAKRSSLFRNSRIEVIPHGTDLNLFKPIEKNSAREILSLDKNKRYVLFGSMNGTSDKRKGFQYLEPALKRLSLMPGHEDLALLVFGGSEPDNPPDLGFPIHYVGRLSDDISLAVLYSAADVTVTPSIQEAFGMTASESMACGTPVVAFGASGPIDVISHKIDGYLAEPYKFEDLSNGISWVLDRAHSKSLAFESRLKCERKFDLAIVADKYKNLYYELVVLNRE